MKLVCLLFLLLFSFEVFAIGKITEMQGSSVEIKRGKNVIKGSMGTVIESNDTVSVGSSSKITITFEDNSTAKISENSKLMIDDFVYDPKGQSKSAMRVGLGTVRMASGGIAKQNSKNVNIRTPTAAIAVRGTDFAMTVDELGRSTVVLLPTCNNDQEAQRIELPGNCTCGKIDVTTSAGIVSMESPFYATHVSSPQETPTMPVRVDPVVMNVSGEGSLNKPHQVAKVIAENQEKKEAHKDKSKTNADEQKAAKDSNKDSDKRKAANDDETIKKALAGELGETKTATAEQLKENPCWPFTSCGNERGFNWYSHVDPLMGNVIHVSTLETTDNTTYDISVNSVDISQRVVGNGTNHVTIRQWNR
jgi:hypothetical protein